MDLFAALLFGFFGGLVSEVIENKGNVELPHRGSNNLFDLGLLANMIIGGGAAWALFYIINLTNPIKFVGATVAAGFSGTSILNAIKETILGAITQREAEDLADEVEVASEIINDLADTLEEVKKEFSAEFDSVSFSDPRRHVLNNLNESINEARSKASEIKKSSDKAKKFLADLR
jgi:hypothetical protein